MKILNKNHDAAIKQNLEFEEKLEKQRLEWAVEKRKRDELIKQIKEAERQPIKRSKGYDPTETSKVFVFWLLSVCIVGYGYLSEMSLFELRERLIIVRKEQKAKEKKIRLANSKNKDKQMVRLMKKVDVIKARRAKRAAENK